MKDDELAKIIWDYMLMRQRELSCFESLRRKIRIPKPLSSPNTKAPSRVLL